MNCHAEGCDRLLLHASDRYYCRRCRDGAVYCSSHVAHWSVTAVMDNPRKARYKQRFLHYEALCDMHAAEPGAGYPD